MVKRMGRLESILNHALSKPTPVASHLENEFYKPKSPNATGVRFRANVIQDTSEGNPSAQEHVGDSQLEQVLIQREFFRIVSH